jgi:undecaprenol kinase
MSDFKKVGFVNKFKNSFYGIWQSIRQEKSVRVHFFVAMLVIAASLFFKVTQTEWLILILTITLVICLEMVNTLAEELCDLYSLDHNLHIRKIKDIAAGSVMLATIASIIIGLIIFLKYI